MVSNLLKRIAAMLPLQWQQELKRLRFRRQIQRDRFRTPEPEWDRVGEWLTDGDWAIDVGANIGHYTTRLSQVVGLKGRVIAFEPVPETFELLSANAAQLPLRNVTLLNMAASDATQVLGISIPTFDTGLKNLYQAALSTAADGLQVMTCAIDSLSIGHRVALIKIDAEGHDAIVLRGAAKLIERDRPIVLIESNSDEVVSCFARLGYVGEHAEGSPNVVYRPAAPAASR